ncbi:MAG: T9SS type B sorting domain-containing protein [Chitinophagaceae bacterium]|nr:MAG: T9SS type B sorting domain-containing protein [Chitinophagaceae bacterium]
MRKALLSLAFVAGSFVAGAQTLPGLILNEVSQGPNVGAGQKEYFEFIVAGTPTCTVNTLDLRGWIIDDNNNWVAAGPSTGIATGAMRFANVANWAAVPYGSIILVYNDNDKNTSITLADDPTDANNDKVYVIPASSTMFERNTVAPTTASGSNFVYPTTNWVSGGDWNTVALRNAGDAIIIVKPSVRNTEYFSLGYAIGSGSTATVWVPDMDSDSDRFLSDGNYNQASSWLLGVATGIPATTAETPGAGNTAANAAWINGMRGPATGVTVDPISSTNGSTLCVGGTTTLSSTTAGGTWSSANNAVVSVNATTGVATGVTAGGPVTITYTVTSGGCTGTATYAITVVAAANAGTLSGGPSVCTGATTTFTTNGTAGGTWSSSNPAVATINPATGVATGVTAGNVTITYTVGSGACATSATAPLQVAAAPVLPAISGNPNICLGGTRTYTNGFAGGSWSSSTPANVSIDPATGVATGMAVGSSVLTYTASNGGCTSTVTYNVQTVALPSAGTLNVPATLCVGSTATFTSTVAGGAWSASPSGLLTVNATTGAATADNAGNATVTYTVTDVNGCAGTATAPVAISAAPVLQPTTGPSSVCVGATIQLTNPFQPNGAGTWSATPAGLVTLTPTLPAGGPHIVNVTALAPGVATITLTAGSGGCTSSVPFVLTINAVPVVAPVLGATNLCSGATVTVTNATPGGTWSSSNPAAATVNPTTGVVTGVATGTADIIYTVTGVGGCTGTNRATINVQTTPNPGANNGPATLCIGATATFTNALAGGTWSSSNTAIASINASTGVVTGVAAGGPVTITYTVTTNGCTGTSNSTLNVNAAPSIAPIANFPLCTGAGTTLTPSVAGGTWSSANTSVATVTNAGVVTGTGTGSAILTYTVTNGGCTATRNVTVTVTTMNAQLNASATTISAGQSVTLTPAFSGTGPFTISAWTPAPLFPNQAAATQTATPVATTTFSVTGSDANGCTATGTVTVVVNPLVTDDLYVPNYFTPNFDGRNDILYFYGSTVATLEFRIFNQWGELVFSTTDKSRGWDGTSGGKAQPVGVYMYVAKATLPNGQTRTLKGSINLIR